jgi:hypothetical protein
MQGANPCQSHLKKRILKGGEINMDNGFSFALQDFCSYCGDFEPLVCKTDISTLSEKRFLTQVRCENGEKCFRLHEQVNKKEQ